MIVGYVYMWNMVAVVLLRKLKKITIMAKTGERSDANKHDERAE